MGDVSAHILRADVPRRKALGGRPPCELPEVDAVRPARPLGRVSSTQIFF